jgi:hypothetical protein
MIKTKSKLHSFFFKKADKKNGTFAVALAATLSLVTAMLPTSYCQRISDWPKHAKFSKCLRTPAKDGNYNGIV